MIVQQNKEREGWKWRFLGENDMIGVAGRDIYWIFLLRQKVKDNNIHGFGWKGGKKTYTQKDSI